MRRTLACLLPLLQLAGCGDDGPLVLDCLPGLSWDIDEQRCVGWDTGTAPPAEPEVVTEALAPAALLRRLSLDLRGTLPTLAELEALEGAEDPDATLAELRDAMLEDPAFEERLVELLGEHWQTMVDDFEIQVQDAGFEMEEEYLFERSVGEEPLRLMARVAVEDRPWSDILSADWTMANDTLVSAWPIEYTDNADDSATWREARYVDGRPATGVLSTNGLWWRYDTNESNANRGRAAAISELLVCVDYHGRPVSFSEVDLSEGAAATSQQDPACVSCHSGLDPIAAALFGFWWTERYSMIETSWYHAERELLGEEVLGVSPAWYGQPADSLGSLGARIQEDPRFGRCATESTTALLWRRPVEDHDRARIELLLAQFESEGLRLKALVRAISDTPEYRAGALVDVASEADAARETTRRVVIASQLSSALTDLAGLRWERMGTSLLHEDEEGFRILAGGLDGRYVRRVANAPTLTWVATVDRVAELAAAGMVERELGEEPVDDGILGPVSLEHLPGDEAFDTALDQLWWRLHAAHPTEEEAAQLAELWLAVAELEGPEGAWQAVLTALFRDPAWLEY